MPAFQYAGALAFLQNDWNNFQPPLFFLKMTLNLQNCKGWLFFTYHNSFSLKRNSDQKLKLKKHLTCHLSCYSLHTSLVWQNSRFCITFMLSSISILTIQYPACITRLCYTTFENPYSAQLILAASCYINGIIKSKNLSVIKK